MSPSPTTEHRRVSRRLFMGISLFTEETKIGEAFYAPYDVFLDEHSNAVQPDIVYVSAANAEVIKRDAIHGVPDMIIEILSQSNSKHDLIKKKELYQRFGVKEYWIINPDTKETIGYTLKDQTFIEQERLTGSIKSAVIGNTFSF